MPPKVTSTRTFKNVHRVINQNNGTVKAQTQFAENSPERWIAENIKMRQCSCFVTSKENTKICQQCGYNQKEHTIANRSEATNAFGTIEFDDHVGHIERKFVRVDIQTDMSTMLKMMQKWGMEKPNLLISVTGGTGDFTMNPRLQDAFQSGLMNAAHSIGAWIITGGTYAGVTKNVGEAVKKYVLPSKNQKHVVAIGIAPWGVIHNRKVLEKKEGSFPAKYYIKGIPKTDKSFLDPNHSHYILVDDGTQNKFETEIPSFRANLEQEIYKMQTERGDDPQPVPIVILVLEGGRGTLDTINKALEKDTPAVIVKGSGGVADILAYAFKHAEMDEGQESKRPEKHMNKSLEDKINEKMMEQHIDSDIEVIRNCLRKSDLIHIFELDSDGHDIDTVILNAFLKAHKNLTADKKKMTDSLDDMMLIAIRQDRADFVELLLDNVILLEKFLTIERLLGLYNNVSSNSIFKDLRLKKKEKVSLKTISKNLWLKIKEKVCSKCSPKKEKEEEKKVCSKCSSMKEEKEEEKKVQDAHSVMTQAEIFKYGKWKSKLKEVEHLIEDLLGYQYIQHYTHDKHEDGVQKNKDSGADLQKKPDFKNPCLDLFVSSVLNNKQDMAKVFWQRGKDKMAAALVAHALLSAMSRKTDDRDLREKLDENSSEFMTLAINIAQKCYKSDDKKTHHLLIREMEQWGNTTCIDIAVNAHDKGFISLKVCLDLLDKIWMGGLKQDNSINKLLVCMAILPMIWLWARFNEKEYDQLNSRNDANESHGQAKVVSSTTRNRPLSARKVGTDSKEQSNGKSAETTNGNQQQTNDKSDETTNNTQGQENNKSDETAKGNDVQTNDKLDKTTNGKRDLTSFEKLTTFYDAPIIIFMYNVISFIAFLFLYSYVLISKLEPQMSVAEIILIVWVFSFFLGEIIQVSRRPASSIYHKCKLYGADGWNLLDMGTILLFIIGMAVLRINPQPDALEAARVILGIDLAFFFLRILHIFHAHRQIGPKLVMIMNMVWDLGSLAAIIGVFILAYAIASYAILYPNTELTIDTVIDIIKRPYWNIYGELNLKEIEGDEDCSYNEELYGNDTKPRCPTKAGQYIVPVMMGIYVFMTNILLISLLIASFSYSIEKVQQQTDLHCSLHRYNLICEYYTRPWLAHPLALSAYLFQIMLYVCKKCHRKCEKCHSKCKECNTECGKCHSKCGKCHRKCAKCHSGCEKCHSDCEKCHIKIQCGKCHNKCEKCPSKMQGPERCLLAALTQRGNAFKQKFPEEYEKELREFEEEIAGKVLKKMEQNHPESINTVAKRLDKLVNKFDELQQRKSSQGQTGSQSEQKTKTGKGSQNLEQKVVNIEKQLNSIANVLQSIVQKLEAK